MKYVWASWGNKLSQQFPGESVNGFKTRHIKGYGCAVTFSYARITWSTADGTYIQGLKYTEPSVTRR
jgi:hypothetical protein